MKLLLIVGLLATPAAALADAPAAAPFAEAPKVQRDPRKLDRDARVYVMDKELPSFDKTVTLARPRTSLKNK